LIRGQTRCAARQRDLAQLHSPPHPRKSSHHLSAPQARLDVPSGVEGANEPVHFQGKFESAAEDTEFVATFDGTSFCLQRLNASATLRHAPGAAREAAAQRTAALNPAPMLYSKAKKKHKPPPKAAEPAAEAEPEAPSGPLNDLEASFFGGGQ